MPLESTWSCVLPVFLPSVDVILNWWPWRFVRWATLAPLNVESWKQSFENASDEKIFEKDAFLVCLHFHGNYFHIKVNRWQEFHFNWYGGTSQARVLIQIFRDGSALYWDVLFLAWKVLKQWQMNHYFTFRLTSCALSHTIHVRTMSLTMVMQT
jgi:hypothetical protein